MAEEEEKSFVVRDRRGRSEGERASESGSASSSTASSPSSSSQAASSQTASTAPSARQEPSREARSQDIHAQPGQGGHEPVTFSGFIFSLGSSALMLMGESLDPQQPNPPVNLPQAKEIIDILSLLESKTRGNLSQDEQAVLTDMLYTLRMKYVDMASGKRTSSQS